MKSSWRSRLTKEIFLRRYSFLEKSLKHTAKLHRHQRERSCWEKKRLFLEEEERFTQERASNTAEFHHHRRSANLREDNLEEYCNQEDTHTLTSCASRTQQNSGISAYLSDMRAHLPTPTASDPGDEKVTRRAASMRAASEGDTRRARYQASSAGSR